MPMAACLANLAAGVVVGKIGTAVVRQADLLADPRPGRRKPVSSPRLEPVPGQ